MSSHGSPVTYLGSDGNWSATYVISKSAGPDSMYNGVFTLHHNAKVPRHPPAFFVYFGTNNLRTLAGRVLSEPLRITDTNQFGPDQRTTYWVRISLHGAKYSFALRR